MAEAQRVRANQVAAVVHPDSGVHVTPNPADTYDPADPLVRAYPWLFSTEDELAERDAAPPVDSVPIERATRAPGERRPTRRGR